MRKMKEIVAIVLSIAMLFGNTRITKAIVKDEEFILQKGENLQKMNRKLNSSTNYQYNSSNVKVVNNYGECIGKGEANVTIIVNNNINDKKTIHVKVQDADDLKMIDNKKNDNELPILTQGCGKFEDDNLSAIQKNGNVYDLQTKRKVADNAKNYVSNYVYYNGQYGEYFRLNTKISQNDELYTSINNGTIKKQGLQITKNIKNYFITKQGELYKLNQNNEVEKIEENVKDIYKCFNADDQEYIVLFKNGDMKFLGHYNKIVSKNIKKIISNHYFISYDNKMIFRGDDLADFYEKFTILDSNPKIVISEGFNLHSWLLLDKNKLYVSNDYYLNEVADNAKEISGSIGDIYEDLNGNYFYIYYEYKDDKRVVHKKQVSYTDKDFTGISKDGTAYVGGNKILNDVKSMKPIRSNANNYDYIFVRKDGTVWGYQAPYIARKILDYDGSSEEQGSMEDVENQNSTTATNKQQPSINNKVIKVSKIQLSGISHQIAAGKKLKLTAKITNNATNKKLIWTTSNKKYATVSQNGIVTFNKKAKGKTVTITATASDGSKQKATFKVKIMKGAVKKITISGKKTVKAGKSIKLKAKVKASKGANKKLLWTSNNPKYAKVTSSGKATTSKKAKKKTVKITAMATDGTGKKNTVTVKIK